MQCSFCKKELAVGTQECPYCHCQLEVETQVLNPQERDTFDGVTIEEDGSSDSGVRVDVQRENENVYGQRPKVQVHTLGCGSSLLLTFLILGGILAVVFLLLPTFLIFAAIGAVVIFIMRLFM